MHLLTPPAMRPQSRAISRRRFRLVGRMIALAAIIAGCAATTYLPATFSSGGARSIQSDVIALVGDPQRTTVWETFFFCREQNDAVHKVVFDRIASENPGALVILGDLTCRGSSDDEWQLFDGYSASIREQHIPTYPVLGNHEYWGNNTTALTNYFAHFPDLHSQQWYTCTFRSIGFIMLNSNFDELSDSALAEQQTWYLKALSQFQMNDSITGIVVCCHHPPFTNSTTVSDDKHVQDMFVGAFINATKARLFITGHCHSYEHFLEQGKHFVVSGGGGGPRQKLEPDTLEQRHRDLCRMPSPRPFHYCTLTIEPHQLRFQMKMVDDGLQQWTVGDEFVIENQ